MPEHIRTKTVRARKSHQCMTCCAVAVKPGQEYERMTLVHDGSIYDWVNCAPCDEAMRYVVNWMDGSAEEGVAEESFDEWARDAGWLADIDPATHTPEQAAALAFLVRYHGTIVDHQWTGVAGHPDDPECAHRTDGTDATYCGETERKHLWGDR